MALELQRFTRTLVSASSLASLTACAGSDSAAGQFTATHETVVSAAAVTLIRSYKYRLSDEPLNAAVDSAVAHLTFKPERAQQASRGLAAERQRKQEYLDELSSAIDTLKRRNDQLLTVASAVRDTELRNASLAITTHYSEIVKHAHSILDAQRAESELTQDYFLMVLDSVKQHPVNWAIPRADEAKSRAKLDSIVDKGPTLYAAWKGIKFRK